MELGPEQFRALESYRPLPLELSLGALIGTMKVLAELPLNEISIWKEAGQYGFMLVLPIEFDKPIPYRGQLRFFDVPEEILIERKVKNDIRTL